MVERCLECRFYKSGYPQETGECHKQPPVRLPRKFDDNATSGNRVRDEILIWGWPQVERNDWCGKFKPKRKVDS